MMTKFYMLLSTKPTYPETRCTAVTTQFGLMMEPLHMCGCLMMTNVYRLLSTKPTYPETRCTAVTTQFGLMMEPLHMCEFEYRSDI